MNPGEQMIRPRLTVAEQLEEVENLIVAFAWSKGTGEPAELTHRALKQVAKDLRARLGTPASTAARVLQQRIDHADRSKTSLGYAHGALVGIGQEVIGRWPVIRGALELAEAMSDQEETRG